MTGVERPDEAGAPRSGLAPESSTWSIAPGSPASAADAETARAVRRLLREELPRIRAAATTWRNGIAGMLAALAGFSLIRGRSDVSKVAPPWDAFVGGLLVLALGCGTAAAMWMLRAVNGPPKMTPVTRAVPVGLADHHETKRAVRALRRGIAASVCCAGLLTAAVGLTWYGPARSGPKIEVAVPGALVCGDVVRVNASTIVVRTAAGEVATAISTVRSLRPVPSCP